MEPANPVLCIWFLFFEHCCIGSFNSKSQRRLLVFLFLHALAGINAESSGVYPICFLFSNSKLSSLLHKALPGCIELAQWPLVAVFNIGVFKFTFFSNVYCATKAFLKL